MTEPSGGQEQPAEAPGANGTWTDESEFTALDAEFDAADGAVDDDSAAERATPRPVLAVVGRPNVGKSTLVNRLLGRRAAVVQDVPGVTRDRVGYDAEWNGRSFTVIDTGGWDPAAAGLQAEVTTQAELAMDTADVVLLVVDGQVGATETEEAAARALRRGNRPVLLAANKVDDQRLLADVAALWSLGLGEPQPVSALHGRSSGDLLDVIVDTLPTAPRAGEQTGGPRRVALVGKPNVGKSSLLNKLAGQQRAVVHTNPGTTVDPVDSLVEVDGQLWRFIDTAGLRKRVYSARGAEYYASLRTKAAIDAAEVVIVLLDASEPIAEQDLRVLSMAVDAGRAVVLALNKWDLTDEERRHQLTRELERGLVRVPWAERVNVSARTGRAVHKLAPAMRTALASWDTRVPTAALNNWLSELVAAQPPPARGGRPPKVMFATQSSIRPPTLVVFTTGFLEAAYRRFIERKFRERFGFTGSPVRVNVRVREERGGKKGSK